MEHSGPKKNINPPIIVWFRRDLRLYDHPALSHALKKGPILPVFIWSPEEEAPWSPGAASQVWLHKSLDQLSTSLKRLGLNLALRKGNSLKELLNLVEEVGAREVFWNRLYEPKIVSRDAEIERELENRGIFTQSFSGHLLFEPSEMKTKEGKPFQVFTPFWKSCLKTEPSFDLTPIPKKMPPSPLVQSLPLSALHLLPQIPWDREFFNDFQPGEKGAQQSLEKFIAEASQNYVDLRNYPARHGTSRLSPHLHFGEISIRVLWNEIKGLVKEGSSLTHKKSLEHFLSELGWREFAHHLIYHFPHTADEALRTMFETFAWRKNEKELRAWQNGLTGYPIVDAGMRELWTSGWMHNRVRMIVASFLTKDLMISWKEGTRWFWNTLMDADLPSNTLGWQWAGGCGADAAPYFRIFNPVLQGRKFDPQGDYVKKWLPVLKDVPSEWIHNVFDAPQDILNKANVKLGENYPKPIVDHAMARARALKAFASMKKR